MDPWSRFRGSRHNRLLRRRRARCPPSLRLNTSVFHRSVGRASCTAGKGNPYANQRNEARGNPGRFPSGTEQIGERRFGREPWRTQPGRASLDSRAWMPWVPSKRNRRTGEGISLPPPVRRSCIFNRDRLPAYKRVGVRGLTRVHIPFLMQLQGPRLNLLQPLLHRLPAGGGAVAPPPAVCGIAPCFIEIKAGP